MMIEIDMMIECLSSCKYIKFSVYHDSDHSARCQALLHPKLVGPGGVTTRGFGDQLQHTSNVDYFIFNALDFWW